MNVSSLKTPGVYINEIDAFPPSVANVATAIPAFIGYTEKGPSEPTRITSMLQFEQIFGGAPQPKNVSIDVGLNKYEVVESKFKLYNSMMLFYQNGGGVCYIVSIGNYKKNNVLSEIKEADFYGGAPIKGINLLEKHDEPTLILFPDAVNLDEVDLKASMGNIQKQALMQCEKMMDRFVIMDMVQKDGLNTDSTDFRKGIGTGSLKYGAAYYPYLVSNFGFNFRFIDIHDKGINFKTEYPDLIPKITDFETLSLDIKKIITDWSSADIGKPIVNTTDKAKVKSYVVKCWKLLKLLQLENPQSQILNSGFSIFAIDLIKINLRPLAQKLFDFETKFKLLDNSYTLELDVTLDNKFFDGAWKNDTKTDFEVSTPHNLFKDLLTSNPSPGSDDTISFAKVHGQLDKMHSAIINTTNSIIEKFKVYELEMESQLISQMPIYSSILAKLNGNMNITPPSGAMAGIYSRVDATRGVWKAPANVSVNGIVGLTDDINDADQMDMNVHETGKSINAIRQFTGKGFLVWGGRTLAGNSNDWRYINVRRLANMMEESCKKACMNFVFEPNVSQTWVNLKGMIENYLTTLWNDGALAGSKPEHAFFVQVGLGQTMTAQDINEGRLIVKIGYAPSKPAEFIILEFKQMQQRS
jgi:uncharacterized protein